MNMKVWRSPVRRRVGSLAMVLIAGLAACENPVEGEHEDHPVGFTIADEQGRPVVTVTSATTVTGQLTAPAGGTRTYTVVAIGEDGDPLTVDGGNLAVRVGPSPSFATVSLQAVNRLTVRGLAAGTGTIRIDLRHGGHDEIGGLVPVVIP